MRAYESASRATRNQSFPVVTNQEFEVIKKEHERNFSHCGAVTLSIKMYSISDRTVAGNKYYSSIPGGSSEW